MTDTEYTFEDVPEPFEWNTLSYLEYETDIGIQVFKLLLNNQEEALSKTKDSLLEVMMNDKILLDEDQFYGNSWYIHRYEYEEKILDNLERKQRNYLILSIFSFFEGRLSLLCKEIQEEFSEKFKIKIDDLSSRDDIMKYWNYLTKVFEIETESVEKFLTPIRQYKKIRNIIAHHNAILPEKNLIEAKELGIILESGNMIKISVENINSLLKKMDSFFEELYKMINKRYLMFPEKQAKWEG